MEKSPFKLGDSNQIVEGVCCSLKELYFEGLKSSKYNLHLRKKATAFHAGQKRSSVRGRGMEFLESRPYVVQDEIRSIDWKVSARLNDVYTKIFTEEKDRPIYLLADLRSHMFFGSRTCFKSVLAARIAARLGFAAINGGDNVGGFILTNDSFSECKPKSSKKGFALLLGRISQATQMLDQDEGKIDDEFWPSAFKRIYQRIHPGCVLFLLSDFFGLDERSKHLLYRLRKKADVFALRIFDPLEEEMPHIGRAGMFYGSSKIVFDSENSQMRKDFNQHQASRISSIQQLFSSQNIPTLEFSTAKSPDQELKKLFGGRW